MGILGLIQWLKRNAPYIFHTIPLQNLYGKRIAIDASIYLYKFVSRENKFDGNWIDLYVRLILHLRRFNIRPLLVFDGKAPDLKDATRKHRREVYAKHRHTADEIKELLDELTPCESFIDIKQPSLEKCTKYLKVSNETIQSYSKEQICDAMYEKYRKSNSADINITPEHGLLLKQVLDAMGLPWVQAPDEAEKHCAWLLKNGCVSAVMTTDSDIHAYGASMVITDVSVSSDFCTMVLNENILEATHFTHSQFVDFCIMCGTDYNDNIKGIGPSGAYQLMTRFGSLEKISEEIDTTVLNYISVRNLFQLSPNDPKYRIPRIRQVSITKLCEMLNKIGVIINDEEMAEQEYTPQFTTI